MAYQRLFQKLQLLTIILFLVFAICCTRSISLAQRRSYLRKRTNQRKFQVALYRARILPIKLKKPMKKWNHCLQKTGCITISMKANLVEIRKPLDRLARLWSPWMRFRVLLKNHLRRFNLLTYRFCSKLYGTAGRLRRATMQRVLLHT